MAGNRGLAANALKRLPLCGTNHGGPGGGSGIGGTCGGDPVLKLGMRGDRAEDAHILPQPLRLEGAAMGPRAADKGQRTDEQRRK